MDKLPFTPGEVKLEPWTVKHNNRQHGVNIYIPVQDNPAGVVLDSLYYQGKAAALESIKKDSYHVYIGRFVDNNASNVILHADPKKEFGNSPTSSKVIPPFAIADHEALLKYTIDGKARYYKLTNLIPATAIYYKELPPSLK